MQNPNRSGGGVPIPNNSGAAIPGGPGAAGGVTNFLNTVRRQQGFAAAQQSFGNNVPVVYLGTTGSGPAPAGKDFRSTKPAVDEYRSISDMMLEFDGWSAGRQRKMAEKLAIGGFFKDKPNEGESLEEYLAALDLGAVQDAYANLLMASAARYAAGQAITPNQLLQQHMDYRQQSAQASGLSLFGSGTGSGSSLANQSVTRTDRSVDIFSAQDARGLARATLRRELDRDPTEAEFEDFVAALQAKQRANPVITNSTVSYDESGNPVKTSSRSRGGLTEAGIDEFATEFAQSQPGWAEWQAVSFYFPSVLDALASGVPGAGDLSR